MTRVTALTDPFLYDTVRGRASSYGVTTMAKRSQPRSKWTAAEVKVQVKRVQEAVDKFKRDHKAEHMTFMSADDVVRKLKRVNSPMIVFQSWNSAAPGGTVSYSLGIYNPDPTLAIWMFAHVWFGSGNVDPVTGTFLSNIDERFPRLTQPAFDGLSLAPGASATLSYSIKIPASVERTNYLANSCLMQFNWHDIGTYLDRSVFVVPVT